jgi:hypothetical protein
VNVASGGSTGTRNIEHENGLTELEAGSYVFMKPDTPRSAANPETSFTRISAPGDQSGSRIRTPRLDTPDPRPELKLGDRVENMCTNLDDSIIITTGTT